MHTTTLLNDLFPWSLGFSLTCLPLVAGGETGAAETAGEGAHPCEGEHRGAQCEGESVFSLGVSIIVQKMNLEPGLVHGNLHSSFTFSLGARGH